MLTQAFKVQTSNKMSYYHIVSQDNDAIPQVYTNDRGKICMAVITDMIGS